MRAVDGPTRVVVVSCFLVSCCFCCIINHQASSLSSSFFGAKSLKVVSYHYFYRKSILKRLIIDRALFSSDRLHFAPDFFMSKPTVNSPASVQPPKNHNEHDETTMNQETTKHRTTQNIQHQTHQGSNTDAKSKP